MTDSDNNVQVNFDTVSVEDDTETSGTTTTTLNIIGATTLTATTNDATVLKMVSGTPNTADGGSAAIAETKGWYVDQGAVGGTVQVVINGAAVPATAYTLTENDAYDANQLNSATNVSAADAAGAVFAAKVGAFSTQTVSLIDHDTGATTASGERYSTNAALTAASTTTLGGGVPTWSVGLDELFTMTVGSTLLQLISFR